MYFYRYQLGKPSDHRIFMIWDEEETDLGFLRNKAAAYEAIRKTLKVKRLNRKHIRLIEMTPNQYHEDMLAEQHRLKEEISHLEAFKDEQSAHLEKVNAHVEDVDMLSTYAGGDEAACFAEQLKQSTFGSVEWAAGETLLRFMRVADILGEF
jgi:hypothetical protein